MNRPCTIDDVILCRQEIINHAHAFNYAIDQMVFDSKLIAEEFLKKVHTKFCAGKVLGEDAGKPGQYRTWEIAARHGEKEKPVCVHAFSIAAYMRQLVLDLQEDMASAEQAGVLDPLDMASRYCHRLVCMHRFGDGNDEERQEYLTLVYRDNSKFHQGDMEVPERDKEGHRELAQLTLRKPKETLGQP